MRRLFRQFSTPGGMPSHVSVPTPGSIHEGGELGYVLAHAFGAAFDNPDLIVAAVVGDGEAETGPLAGSWKGISFLNPARDGAVLPILHLNGYKIAGPTVLGRASRRRGPRPARRARLRGPLRRGRRSAARCTRRSPRRSTRCYERHPRHPARGARERRLRTPALAGHRAAHAQRAGPGPRRSTACRSRAPSAPTRCRCRTCGPTRSSSRCSRSGCAVYRPEELFDEDGRLVPELAALAPRGDRRMGANPHANGGRLLVDLDLPDFRDYAVDVEKPATERHESTRQLGKLLRDIFARNARAANFRLFCPDETNSNRLGDVFEVENRCFVGPTIPIDDHVSPRRPGDGGAQRAPLRGLAGGLPPDRPPRALRDLRGVRHGLGLDDGAAHQVARRRRSTCPGATPVASLEHPADLDLLAQRPQRLQPPGAGPDRRHALQDGARSRASTCRPTPTACSRWPTTASAAATTST